MTFDKETLQTLLNLPDIAVDRVVLGERKTLRRCMKTIFFNVRPKQPINSDSLLISYLIITNLTKQ
jgi:hypothetical protein